MKSAMQAMLEKRSGKTAYLTSNSTHTIYYKPENGSWVGSIGPGGVLYEEIDGAATAKYRDAVIKIPNGASLTLPQREGTILIFMEEEDW